MIKGISDQLRLPRRGKIRLGEKKLSKSGKEYPSSLDFFMVPPEVAEIYPDKPRKLDIMIPMEDTESFFPQYFKRYGSSAGLVCKGDGETATLMEEDSMKEIECQGQECQHYQDKECRRVGNLQVILPKVKGLGVYQIDTSSRNSIVNLNSGLKMLRGMLGRISWIPLVLEVKMQEAHPLVNNKRIKTIVPVMSITSDISVYDLLKMRLPGKQAEIVNPDIDEKEPLLFPDKDGSIKPDKNTDLALSDGKEQLSSQEKEELAEVDKLGKKEVEDEPGGKVLSEEEAQKEQAKLLEKSKLPEQGKPKEKPENTSAEHDKEWQDKTRGAWYRMVKIMYKINYFSDEASYRAWMAEKLDGINSYKLLTDNQRTAGINLMVVQANNHAEKEQAK